MENKLEDVIIMNFSHAYENQDVLHKKQYRWMDCTRIKGTGCYLDEQAKEALIQNMKGCPLEAIHFLDSGNYHYVSKLWTDQIHEPFTLVVLDHHTDLQPPMFEGILSCGSWVRAVLEENPYIEHVVGLGAAEHLIAQAKETDERVCWYGESILKGRGIRNVITRLRFHSPVYISIDKDVLSSKEAATNWEQGNMSFEEMHQIIAYLMENDDVIGVDICGESGNGPLLRRQREDALNNRINGKLLACLERKEKKAYETAINY